jgi:hypothetical protein
MTDPVSFRTAQEFLSPVLVRLFPLNPQLQLGEKLMINLKAAPKGEGFSPIPRGDIKEIDQGKTYGNSTIRRSF